MAAESEAALYKFLPRRHDPQDWRVVCEQQQWPAVKKRAFGELIGILEQSRLSKLVLTGTDKLNAGHTPHESALLELHSAQATERLRHLLGELEWEDHLLSWLNTAAFDLLDRNLLEQYVTLLRHLRRKIPRVLDKSALLDSCGSRRGGSNNQLKTVVLTAPPLHNAIPARKWKLPGPPLFVLAPCEYSWESASMVGWRDGFARLGDAIVCQLSPPPPPGNTLVLVQMLEKRLRQLKAENNGRPLVVVGLSLGVKVAIAATANESVDLLVCIGLHIQGKSSLLEAGVSPRELVQLSIPTLFAVGQRSRACPVSLMEEVRHKMAAKNKLVIVRDGDEILRIPLSKRIQVKLTQQMFNQLVLQELCAFVLEIVDKGEESGNASANQQAGAAAAPDAAPGAVSATKPAEEGAGAEDTPTEELAPVTKSSTHKRRKTASEETAASASSAG